MAICFVYGLGVASAQAQVVGVGADPSIFAPGASRSARRKGPTPLSLALAESFSSATWLAVGISSSTTAADIAGIMRKGTYRLELLQLTLMAKASGKRLIELISSREKGKALRKMASEFELDYDELYEKALDLGRRVSKRANDFKRVRVLKHPPPGARRSRKPRKARNLEQPEVDPRKLPGLEQPR